MPDQNYLRKLTLRIFPHGILLVLVLSLIFLSVMAFVNPVAQGATATPSPSSTSSVNGIEADVTQPVDQTQTEEILPPPTPEEIGSTSGIIFWSTILVLILLIGTLRETTGHKGQ